MPEYRHDPLTGRTVVIAEERASRPHQFDIEDTGNQGDKQHRHCPFCEGNEKQTTPEVDAFREPGTRPDAPGWTVRVVPNKFPAVTPGTSGFPEHVADLVSGERCLLTVDRNLTAIPGKGLHEVLIDTPRHVLSLSDMTDEETADMLRMYARRLRRLRAENRWSSVQIFKNVGAAAGASIPHAHSQLIAMPFTPAPLRTTLHRALEYRRQTDRVCFWCDMLHRERELGLRIVEETEHALALCPFVSRFSAEVEIYPKRHLARFSDLDEETVLPDLAALARRTIRRLNRAVSWMKGDLSYNIILSTEPFEAEGTPYENALHTHLSILPSLARAAGFEWGTGLHINPISPEAAAAKLREAES